MAGSWDSDSSHQTKGTRVLCTKAFTIAIERMVSGKNLREGTKNLLASFNWTKSGPASWKWLEYKIGLENSTKSTLSDKGKALELKSINF